MCSCTRGVSGEVSPNAHRRAPGRTLLDTYGLDSDGRSVIGPDLTDRRARESQHSLKGAWWLRESQPPRPPFDRAERRMGGLSRRLREMPRLRAQRVPRV